MHKPLLIVSAGKTFPSISATEGDFDRWIADGLGDALPRRHLDAQAEAVVFPDPSSLAGVVVSGSHAMVSDREAWSERLGGWMRDCVAGGVPLLGICYGHQLLAHTLGGVVDHRAAGPEVGTRTVQLCEAAAQDPLLAGMPVQFPGQLVHYQSVVALPQGATLLAHSAHEPHQAFRMGACAWGLQFHPEFSATAMRGYLAELATSLPDAATLAAQVTATEVAGSLLRRFAELALQRVQGCAPVSDRQAVTA